MRILVIEDTPHGADAIRSRLVEAGHDVRSCHDPDAEAFPCAGMGGPCPVDEGVDATVVLRSSDGAPTARTAGARCAARADIPLVVAGDVGPGPYAPWTTERCGSEPDDVVAAVEHGTAQPLPRLSGLVQHQVVEALAHRGLETTAATSAVRRRGADLHVVVDPGVGVDDDVASALGVRALAGLDGVRSRCIDVSIRR